jgi:hypothetical protein
MSNLTDYGENRFADMVRGQGLTFPASWRFAPLSAASDSALTEITGSGIARAALTRNLTNFSGTQGAGTTLASSGTSRTTSNNVDIDMGIAPGAVGTMTHVGLFDAASGGNCWAYAQLGTPVVTAAAVALLVPAGSLAFTLGLSGGPTDYLINLLLDKFLRGQAFTYPSSVWLAPYVAGGAEVGGGVGYSRLELESTLTALSGTQAPGTTSASSGTGGRISNNNPLVFADPTGTWGDIDRLGVFDASSAGNELWRAALATTKSIGVGLPLTFQADKVGFTFA